MSSARVPATLGSIGQAAERGGVGDLEGAGDLAAQRDAGGDGVVDERRTAEAVEHHPVDARRPGEQGDDRAWAHVELVQRRLTGRADHAGRDRDGVGRRIALGLVERRGDDADAAVGRLDEAVGERRRAGREHLDDLGRRDRQGLAVDDQAVDELRDLVDGVGDEARRRSAGGPVRRRPRCARAGCRPAHASAGGRRRASTWDGGRRPSASGPSSPRRRSTSPSRARRASHDFPYPGGASRRTTGGTSGDVRRASSEVRERRYGTVSAA